MSISKNVFLWEENVNLCICQEDLGFMCVCFFYMYTVECMYICLNVFMYLCIYMLASQTREIEREREREREISPWRAIELPRRMLLLVSTVQ